MEEFLTWYVKDYVESNNYTTNDEEVKKIVDALISDDQIWDIMDNLIYDMLECTDLPF